MALCFLSAHSEAQSAGAAAGAPAVVPSERRVRTCSAAFTLEVELSQDERKELFDACLSSESLACDGEQPPAACEVMTRMFAKLSWHGGAAVGVLVDAFGKALPSQTPSAAQRAFLDGIAGLPSKPGCKSQWNAIERYVEWSTAGHTVAPPLTITALATPDCLKELFPSKAKAKVKTVSERLAELELSGRHVLTVFAPSGAQVQALVAGEPAYRIELAPLIALPTVQLYAAVLERPVTTTVRVDFEAAAKRDPLLFTFPATRDTTFWADPPLACVIVDVAHDKHEAPSIYIDHVPVENRRPVLVPVNTHDLHVLAVDGDHADKTPTLQVADRLEASDLTSGKDCLRLHFDLSRRETVTLLPVTVAPTCAKQSTDADTVGEIAREYLRELPAEEWKFQDFGAWLATIRGVEHLIGQLKGLGGKAVGGSRARAGTDESVAALAGELTRQGFHRAISIQVDCGKRGGPRRVKATSINLRELVRKGRDPSRGLDLDGILREVSASPGRDMSLFDVIRAPLAELFEQPYAWFPLARGPRSLHAPGRLVLTASSGRGGNVLRWSHARLEEGTNEALERSRTCSQRGRYVVLSEDDDWSSSETATLDEGERTTLIEELDMDRGVWVIRARLEPPPDDPDDSSDSTDEESRRAYEVATCVEITQSRFGVWARAGVVFSVGGTVDHVGGLVLAGFALHVDDGEEYSIGIGGHVESGSLSSPPSWHDLFERTSESPPLPFRNDGTISIEWTRRSLWLVPLAVGSTERGGFVRVLPIIDIGWVDVDDVPEGLGRFRHASPVPDVDGSIALMLGSATPVSRTWRLGIDIMLGVRAIDDLFQPEDGPRPVTTRDNGSFMWGFGFVAEGP